MRDSEHAAVSLYLSQPVRRDSQSGQVNKSTLQHELVSGRTSGDQSIAVALDSRPRVENCGSIVWMNETLTVTRNFDKRW